MGGFALREVPGDVEAERLQELDLLQRRRCRFPRQVRCVSSKDWNIRPRANPPQAPPERSLGGDTGFLLGMSPVFIYDLKHITALGVLDRGGAHEAHDLNQLVPGGVDEVQGGSSCRVQSGARGRCTECRAAGMPSAWPSGPPRSRHRRIPRSGLRSS